MRRAWLKLLAATALLTPFAASAYNFMPTSMEFTSWPKYCQARYVETVIGRGTEYAARVSEAERRVAEASIGSDTYSPVHHHCAGLALVARAKLEPDPTARKRLLKRAIEESGYTLRGVTPASPLYASINANLARAEQGLGNIPAAEGYYERTIAAKPADSQSYIGLAILYKETKRLDLARSTLEKGLTSIEGEGIELHYTLGLMCLELKDTACAQEHARVAYEKGYPLPGLKRKLAERGLWTE
jgi:tetratricopeptide (TPR) repeat protein